MKLLEDIHAENREQNELPVAASGITLSKPFERNSLAAPMVVASVSII